MAILTQIDTVNQGLVEGAVLHKNMHLANLRALFLALVTLLGHICESGKAKVHSLQ